MPYTYWLLTLSSIIWIGFSGQWTWFHGGVGLIVVAVLIPFLRYLSIHHCTTCRYYSLKKILCYAVWLMKEIILSTIKLIPLVWGKKSALSPTIITLATKQHNQVGHTLYGNSITLTPGTICIDTALGKVIVHCLTKAVQEDLQQGIMDTKVRALMKE